MRIAASWHVNGGRLSIDEVREGGDGDVGVRFWFQAEDGIRDLVRSRGLGDVYKRQPRAGPRPRSGVRCLLPSSPAFHPPSACRGKPSHALSLIHI